MAVPVLSVEKCSKIYDNGFKAVHNVSFTIKPGQFTVLLGLNGAGKSSLISMITGLSRITQGHIKIMGHDLETAPFAAKRCFGVCPQEVNFNHFHSIEQELVIAAGLQGLSRSQTLDIAKPLLEKARLWTKRHELIRSLSGGMKRILMVIRAMLHSPDLLILDEPTAGLDIEIRDFIWEVLRNTHAKNTAVLLTTHNMAEAQNLCENVLLLQKGQLLRNQSIQEALTSLSLRIYQASFAKAPNQIQLGQLKAGGLHLQPVPSSPLKWLLETREDFSLARALEKLSTAEITLTDIQPAKNQLEQLLQETTSHG